MDRAETGRRGEAAAARFYEKQGAALITHNYHTRMGEIDLILREPDGTLVFCEVKTRAKDSLDTPAAAVNAAKQCRIIASAAWYLQSTHQSDEPVRFDVAEVVPLDSGRWMVHIIKGVSVGKGRKRLWAAAARRGQVMGLLAKRSDNDEIFQHERPFPHCDRLSGDRTGPVG